MGWFKKLVEDLRWRFFIVFLLPQILLCSFLKKNSLGYPLGDKRAIRDKRAISHVWFTFYHLLLV